jgi:hypothetical protein
VYEVAERRRYFLLYLSELHFLFLPKTAIKDPQELHALRELLQSRLGERAKLKARDNNSSRTERSHDIA